MRVLLFGGGTFLKIGAGIEFIAIFRGCILVQRRIIQLLAKTGCKFVVIAPRSRFFNVVDVGIERPFERRNIRYVFCQNSDARWSNCIYGAATARDVAGMCRKSYVVPCLSDRAKIQS